MARHDGNGRPTRAKGVVHELVAQTAKEMAAAVYEGMATAHNDFYVTWPSLEAFVRRRWTTFIQPAREQLAEMLAPDKQFMTTPDQRDQIFEALRLNAIVNPAANLVDRVINTTSH